MRINIGQRDDRTTLTARILSELGKRLDAVEVSRDSYAGDEAYMQWGFKLTQGLQYAIDHGLPYLIVDWGYFSDRESCISISFNGFHGLSMPVSEVQRRKPRWHPDPLPWRTDGEYAYVFGQLQNDRAVRGLNMEPWIRETAAAAGLALGMPTKIRPHPKMISSWENPLPPLDRVLEECGVAITWTSSVGILTALAGVPTVAMHPASPAAPVAASTFEIVRPPRREWLRDLSWRNYRVSELDEACTYIRLGLDQAAVLAAAGVIDTEGLRV